VHLRQVGLNSILRAMDTAVEAGINQLSISVAYQREEELDVIREQFTERYGHISIVGWPIMEVGRAKLHPHLYEGAPRFQWYCLQRSCGVQTAFSPIVHPNGDLHACYRVVMTLREKDPFILGNVGESKLDEILNRPSNSVLAFVVACGGGSLGYLLEDSPFDELLHVGYQGVCHFCHDVLSLKSSLNYIKKMIENEGFEERIREGLERAYLGWPTKWEKPSECIIVCNGKNCSRGSKNYPVIHYLLNRLMDTGAIKKVQVDVTDCLDHCDTGPNFYLKNHNLFLTRVTHETIEKLIAVLNASSSELNGGFMS